MTEPFFLLYTVLIRSETLAFFMKIEFNFVVSLLGGPLRVVYKRMVTFHIFQCTEVTVFLVATDGALLC